MAETMLMLWQSYRKKNQSFMTSAKSFDCNPPLEVRGIFLDISKAFDRVWHDGLIYKIKSFGVTDTPLKLIENFLSNRYQRVVLNGQSSSWAEVSAGVPQGSVLGPLFFLMYINDLTCGLSLTTKLFGDDTSLLSVVHDVTQSTNELNDDLEKISDWAYQWKMAFNPDKSKQAQEVILSCKTQRVIHPPAIFNNMPVVCSSCQKHLGLYLDEKLNFYNHIKETNSKANKVIDILRKLYNVLPRNSLITIYKSFVRPHLDYGAIIFDQPENESFCKKIESVQYNAALAIIGAIQGTSSEKLYKELGLETLKSRRWLKNLCCFYKIKNRGILSYLAELIPSEFHSYNTRNTRNITT